MRYEKEFKTDNGKLLIAVSFWSDHSGIKWSVENVLVKDGKQKHWRNTINSDDYMWRKLSMEDRYKSNLSKWIEIACIDRINETFKEAHASIDLPIINL